ncbi:nucleotide exchange factor GrpE [Methanocella arvoryzae]|uniref:Nucleotide exchange factor GrpE n=1 Tax=Methanocella arvoryzae (strain DSM 22066 / NBRC 105507 / MRE50) TaxID=351160 RepID=Q0W3A4_METAR|nr:nucleotide exchange factor GrpE [Methanocella arvoryzae]CAJ37139.1 hypothetical protein RCIX1977 [Methanocella arvoryzae MRE50]
MMNDRAARSVAPQGKDTPAGLSSLEERYAQELMTRTQGFRDVLLSYMKEVQKERISMANNLEVQLLSLIEVCDGLSGYIRQYEGKNVEGFGWIVTVYSSLLQRLEQAGVAKIPIEKGEPFDDIRHEIINLADRPPKILVRPTVRYVAMPGYYLKNKVLRKARVEVDWAPRPGVSGR